MEQIKNIFQRISSIMADLEYLQKEDKKVNGQYRFVSHDKVSGAIHPLLVKHGVVIIPFVKEMNQEGNRTQVKLRLEVFNIDDPNDLIAFETYGYGIDQGDKGPGKAFSYAYKYALLKLFCLETGDDPDNDADAKFAPSKDAEKKPEIINPTQIRFFKDQLIKYNLDEDWLWERFGITSWNEITQDKLQSLTL